LLAAESPCQEGISLETRGFRAVDPVADPTRPKPRNHRPVKRQLRPRPKIARNPAGSHRPALYVSGMVRPTSIMSSLYLLLVGGVSASCRLWRHINKQCLRMSVLCRGCLRNAKVTGGSKPGRGRHQRAELACEPDNLLRGLDPFGFLVRFWPRIIRRLFSGPLP